MTTNIIGVIGFVLIHIALVVSWTSTAREWIRYRTVGIAPALIPVTGFMCWLDWILITGLMGAS